jgi:hypothetical protein
MSTLNSSEEVAIIDGAIKTIIDLKAALQAAVQSLTPQADENLKLRNTIRQLEADDAASDAALARLRNIATPAALVETPPADPAPEAPAPETPEGVDPIDPPAPEQATEEPAPAPTE